MAQDPRPTRVLVPLAFAAAVLAAAAVSAREASIPTALGAGGLELPQATLELDPVRAEELRQGPTANGSASAVAQVGAGRMDVEFATPERPVTGSVRRSVPGVWRYLPGTRAGTPAGFPRIRVVLESNDGRQHVLACADSPQVTVPVFVRERSPRSVSLGAGLSALEGDVEIEIPLGGLARACRYVGRLVVRVEGY